MFPIHLPSSWKRLFSSLYNLGIHSFLLIWNFLPNVELPLDTPQVHVHNQMTSLWCHELTRWWTWKSNFIYANNISWLELVIIQYDSKNSLIVLILFKSIKKRFFLRRNSSQTTEWRSSSRLEEYPAWRSLLAEGLLQIVFLCISEFIFNWFSIIKWDFIDKRTHSIYWFGVFKVSLLSLHIHRDPWIRPIFIPGSLHIQQRKIAPRMEPFKWF